MKCLQSAFKLIRMHGVFTEAAFLWCWKPKRKANSSSEHGATPPPALGWWVGHRGGLRIARWKEKEKMAGRDVTSSDYMATDDVLKRLQQRKSVIWNEAVNILLYWFPDFLVLLMSCWLPQLQSFSCLFECFSPSPGVFCLFIGRGSVSLSLSGLHHHLHLAWLPSHLSSISSSSWLYSF